MAVSTATVEGLVARTALIPARKDKWTPPPPPPPRRRAVSTATVEALHKYM